MGPMRSRLACTVLALRLHRRRTTCIERARRASKGQEDVGSLFLVARVRTHDDNVIMFQIGQRARTVRVPGISNPGICHIYYAIRSCYMPCTL
jgi:hypothetical protein